MNFLKLSIFFAALVMIGLTSCGDEKIDSGSIVGQEYFPVEIGKYMVYQSDSLVVLNGGNDFDTLRSYIREEIGEAIIDSENDTSYKVYRYFKRDLDDDWHLSDVWTTKVSNINAQRTEENLKFIKMVFPPRLNARWDGNSFFNTSQPQIVGNEPVEIYDNWNYKITKIDSTFVTPDGLTFENSIIVEQVDYETSISYRKSYEVYAPNVGLINKHMEIYCSQNQDGTLTWLERAEAGFMHTLTILEHN